MAYFTHTCMHTNKAERQNVLDAIRLAQIASQHGKGKVD